MPLAADALRGALQRLLGGRGTLVKLTVYEVCGAQREP